MLSTTFNILSIVAVAVPETETETEILYTSPNDYSDILLAISEKLTALNENIVTLNTWAEQIYTILVYLLAFLIIYGVGKLLSSLFVT